MKGYVYTYVHPNILLKPYILLLIETIDGG